MNIIELVKEIISEFPKITELSAAVQTDFVDGTTYDNFGIYPIGDTLIKESITGKQTRQHNFILYAVFQGFEDYSRLMNTAFLLELAYWLEQAANEQEITVTIDGRDYKGALIKLSSANGMLYGYTDGSLSGPVTYQIQIYAQYHLESEVF